jgi:PAP2 superfamily protein
MQTTSRSPRAKLLRAIGLELLLVIALLGAYRYGRMLISHTPATAFHNAGEMVGWEQTLHLPNELAVQHLLMSSQWLARFANIYYFSVHFPLTAGFLIWMFIRSREQYTRIRTSMAMLTGFALLIHAAFPLAPARMLHGLGFVDTAAIYGPNVYATSPPARLGGEPVRRDAEPALRVGGAGRGRVHPGRQDTVAVAVDRAPDHHPVGDRRHRQPLLARRRRRRRTDHRDRTRHQRLEHHRQRTPPGRHQLRLAHHHTGESLERGPRVSTDSGPSQQPSSQTLTGTRRRNHHHPASAAHLRRATVA